jgi:hypothetical protein
MTPILRPPDGGGKTIELTRIVEMPSKNYTLFHCGDKTNAVWHWFQMRKGLEQYHQVQVLVLHLSSSPPWQNQRQKYQG